MEFESEVGDEDLKMENGREGSEGEREEEEEGGGRTSWIKLNRISLFFRPVRDEDPPSKASLRGVLRGGIRRLRRP